MDNGEVLRPEDATIISVLMDELVKLNDNRYYLLALTRQQQNAINALRQENQQLKDRPAGPSETPAKGLEVPSPI